VTEKAKMPKFGARLLGGLREAVAWKRGDLALEIVDVVPTRPTPVRKVRATRANFRKEV
jgi:hypothetical protein